MASTRSRASEICSPSVPAEAVPDTPVGARYLPYTSRNASDHSPVVTPAFAASIEAGMTFAPSWAAFLSASRAFVTPALSRVPRNRSRRSIWSACCSEVTFTMWKSPSPTRGDGSVCVSAFTPRILMSPDSMPRTRRACDATSCSFMYSMASTEPPLSENGVVFVPRCFFDLFGLGLDDLRALEDVFVLEEIGFVGEDLLRAPRPLLVPGAGKAKGFVPRRELDGARSRVTRERHAQGLEQDAVRRCSRAAKR